MAEVDEVGLGDLTLNGKHDGPSENAGAAAASSTGGFDTAEATLEAEGPDARVAAPPASAKGCISQHCFSGEGLDTTVHFQVRLSALKAKYMHPCYSHVQGG
jgi:hypothetical protein